jgi:hypothetical protein
MEESMVTATDILRDMRAILSDPSRFAQGAAAVDADGVVVPFSSSEAVAFCATGAEERAYFERGLVDPLGGTRPGKVNLMLDLAERLVDLLDAAVGELHPDSYDLVRVNDRLGREAVLAVIDRAIELDGEGA